MVDIPISGITVDNRLRKEMGNIDELSNSIREYGLIQPIILFAEIDGEGTRIKLIAGGRRLEAVKRLGWKELQHGRDFIWREELRSEKTEIRLRLQAVELEENLKRKELTWQEQVEGKKRLLDLMQSIYGVPRLGAPTRSERQDPNSRGFGVNRLAAMLGENKSITSQDLELADAVEKIPSLRKSDTKESARRTMNILGTVVQMKQTAATRASAVVGEAPAKLWVLYEGDFLDNVAKVPDESVDLVYTDLPFGVSLSAMSKHNKGLVEYSDSRDSVVSQLSAMSFEAYRILRPDRYAIFFFGFNYYTELCEALDTAGFAVNPVPIVWFKHTRSTENPNSRYANAYDPALVVSKGSPCFIRPGNTNVVDLPAVAGGDKLQIAQQPVALVERFILDMTAAGAVVCDLCAGSGTTGVAALKNKREVILFEREPAACALIKARLGAM